MAEAQLQHEKNDHIVLKRNFKGEYGWESRVFFDSDDENAAEATIEKLGFIDRSLKAIYGD
jgi:hypothetical protein